MKGEKRMNKQKNPETDRFFDITLRKREDYEDFEERYRKEERKKYNTIMREARKLCPIDYKAFCHLLKYKHNIPYFGAKNLTNRYLEDLISVGKLALSEDRTVTIAEVSKQ
jgi:hypothetical protein